MRLDQDEKEALKYALQDVSGDIYIFGSRVDDQKKGGDIDLLIFSQKNPLTLSRDISVHFFMKCEEKIDVVVMDSENLTDEQQAFLNIIVKQKIK